MKKGQFLLLVIAPVILSCKKTYNCECTSVSKTSGYYSASAVSTTEYKERKREDAVTKCESGTAVVKSGPMEVSNTCVLK